MPRDYSERRHMRTSSAAEEVLCEWTDDLAFGGIGALPVALAAIARAAGGATLTLRVRIGGSPGSADGAIGAEVSTASSSQAQVLGAGSVTNPAAQTLIKLTGFISNPAQSADITGAVVRVG